MSTTKFVYRVHPAIGFARVGNSEEYYLGPETMAGLPVPGQEEIAGGLPIRPGTESETITSRDLRDREGALKRQAARFRIFQYPKTERESYPNGGGIEIAIGCEIDGKTVTDIIWTVHLANKKANAYILENPDLGPYQSVIDGYRDENLPPLRNPAIGPDPDGLDRLGKLVIDPGPRAISGTSQGPVRFDKTTPASFGKEGTGPISLPHYPKSFPDAKKLGKLDEPTGAIDTLGELRTDERGRLLVLGGYGRACAWSKPDGTFYSLDDDVDNNGWFDDTADGPVSATIVFDDGSIQEVHGAWVVSTDPAYAPQILNIVSLWDDIYDSWLRKLRLRPEVFKNGFQSTYSPSFQDEVYPVFRGAALQVWATNLPPGAARAHETVGRISPKDKPAETIMTGLAYVRNPNHPTQANVGAPLMPFHLGDQGQAFLSPTFTQYFFLSQWNEGNFDRSGELDLGKGEYLDKAVLVNCLGGRFSPGIDMTFIVREPELYQQDWETSGAGPFRILAKSLDYEKACPDRPFLSEGYVPLHSWTGGLEPGDTSKFMAIPWHTDYNSCATHELDPNPLKSTTLYWSWPAQRPVAVYPASEVIGGKLGKQRYSVRGAGTESDNPANQGRYQNRLDMIKNWQRIGTVLQGSAIEENEADYSPEQYLEVASQLKETADFVVTPWPMNASKPPC